MTYTYCCVYSTPDDGQKTCPKHVEFYSKNKFEKLVHLVGFITRIQTFGVQEDINYFLTTSIIKWKAKFQLDFVEI